MMAVGREKGGLTEGVRRGFAGDPLLSALLTLHGLHPEETATRVEAALEQVRPYLASHAGDVVLVGIDDDRVARVRLEGTCDGCASSAATVRGLVERAIQEAAPEIARVEVEASTAPAPPASAGARLVQ